MDVVFFYPVTLTKIGNTPHDSSAVLVLFIPN